MLKVLISLLIAFFGVAGSYVAYQASGANGQNGQGGSSTGGIHGAPGPLAGAGLPVVAVGYGVYWLVRRRRKDSKPDQAS